MGKTKLFMVTRKNLDIFEKAKQFKFHDILPTKAEAKRLEKELSKEHLEFNGVALTDNYIIKIEPDRPINEYVVKPDNSILWSDTFSWMRYDEILWVYSDVGGGVPSDFVHETTRTAIHLVLTGTYVMTTDDVRAIFVVYPKDEDRAMIICDTEKFYLSTIREIKGKIKVSDEFDRFRDEIINRLPDDCLLGDTLDNKETYYDAIGKKIPEDKSEWYRQDSEGDDTF